MIANPTSMAPRRAPNTRSSLRGFSLIELMIAMVLGLVVIGAAMAVFLSNKDSYRTNRAVGQVQENARIAFELIARDVRQAGVTGCGNAGRVGNVLNNGTAAGGTVAWYADFGNAIRGYDGGTEDPAVTSGSASAQRVLAASSVTLIGAAMASASIAGYNGTTYGFTLTGANPGIRSGDLVVVCDPDHAVLAQISACTPSVSGSPQSPCATSAALTVNTGTTTPGNCSRGLGFTSLCTAAGNPYSYGVNSQMAQLSAVVWFIGNNPVGSRSLYRRTLVNQAGEPTPTSQEMVRNVTDLQISYHVIGATAFATAAQVSSASNWANVDAVRLVLTLQGSERNTGTDGQAITRLLTSTVNLRNRG